MATIRPKRMYPLPAHLHPRQAARRHRFGWRGLDSYIALLVTYAAPEAFFIWRFGQADTTTFVILSAGWAFMFAMFLVIARPWQRRPS